MNEAFAPDQSLIDPIVFQVRGRQVHIGVYKHPAVPNLIFIFAGLQVDEGYESVVNAIRGFPLLDTPEERAAYVPIIVGQLNAGLKRFFLDGVEPVEVDNEIDTIVEALADVLSRLKADYTVSDNQIVKK